MTIYQVLLLIASSVFVLAIGFVLVDYSLRHDRSYNEESLL